MESITGRRAFLAELLRRPGPRDLLGLAIGVPVLGVIVAFDIALGRDSVLSATYLLAPFIAAIIGGVRATVLLSIAAIGLDVGSGALNENFGMPDFWVRMGGLVIGTGVAVAGAWGRERARLNSRRLELLDSVGAIADGSVALDETLRRVTELIVPAAADMCMVDAIHGGRVNRAATRVRGHPDSERIEEGLRRREPSVPRWMVTDEPAWRRLPRFLPRMRDEDVRRLAHGPEDLAFLRSLRPRSTISAPMVARGRSLGALTLVTSWSRRRYTSDDVHFTQILAGRVALALDNAGLFSDLESVERRMDAVMSRIAEAVAVHDAGGALVYVNETAAAWLGYDSPEELLAAPGRDIRSRYEIFTESGERVEEGDLVRAEMQRGNLPFRRFYRVVTGRGGEERWVQVTSSPIEGPDGDNLYAVTTVEDLTEVKRAEFAQRLLARTGELLASSVDHRTTLDAVAKAAVPQFADWCTVNIPAADGRIDQVAVAHADPAKVELAHRLDELYPVHMEDDDQLPEVIRTGKPLVMEVTQDALRRVARDSEHHRLMRTLGIGSVLAVPMTAGAKTVGALVFVNDSASRRFDGADVDLASEIARRAGVAVENTRIASERSEVARVLQRGLMPPHLPDMPGWETATLYRPAGEVNEVGGDFYDAFEVEGGWMIVVGDVVGRGAEAASLTALARYTIRTAGTLTADPLAALRMLDAALRERAESAICTAAIVVLPGDEPGREPVRIVSAGHPLPLLARGGEVVAAGAPGPLLGALGDTGWELGSVPIDDGDRLIIYTDGVTEARGERGRFGEDRLRAELAGAADPAEIVATVETALGSFASGPPQDDAAVVAIMRKSDAAAATATTAAAGAEIA
jgi:PAS domain S-box-containing protein